MAVWDIKQEDLKLKEVGNHAFEFDLTARPELADIKPDDLLSIEDVEYVPFDDDTCNLIYKAKHIRTKGSKLIVTATRKTYSETSHFTGSGRFASLRAVPHIWVRWDDGTTYRSWEKKEKKDT